MAAYFTWKWGSPAEPQWWQILRILLPGMIATASASFPIYWYFRPNEHLVRRAVCAHGNPDHIGAVLDREMESPHEVFGPFHFTRTYLVYETGYNLNVVPYDTIVGAQVVVGIGDDADTLSLITRDGKTYDWHRTFIQGYFDASQVLAKIQSAAGLDVRPKQ